MDALGVKTNTANFVLLRAKINNMNSRLSRVNTLPDQSRYLQLYGHGPWHVSLPQHFEALADWLPDEKSLVTFDATTVRV
jgi:hypothetical protein